MANTTGGKIFFTDEKTKKSIYPEEIDQFLKSHPGWRRGYPYKKHKPHSEATKERYLNLIRK